MRPHLYYYSLARAARSTSPCLTTYIYALTISEEELTALALEALLVRLYERGDLSSGKAAELPHISRCEFLELLSEYGFRRSMRM
ncbi:MAG TPA: UPF0175 family protein [Chloroflexia bacterium]